MTNPPTPSKPIPAQPGPSVGVNQSIGPHWCIYCGQAKPDTATMALDGSINRYHAKCWYEIEHQPRLSQSHDAVDKAVAVQDRLEE